MMKRYILRLFTRSTAQELIYAAGYGSFCAWMIIAFHATGQPLLAKSGILSFEAFSITFLITLIATAIAGQRIRAFLLNKRTRFVLALGLCVVGLLAFVLSLKAYDAGGFFSIALSLCSGVCAALFLQTWASVYSLLPTKAITVSNALSYLFNSLIIFAIGSFSQMIALVISPCLSIWLMQIGINLADEKGCKRKTSQQEAFLYSDEADAESYSEDVPGGFIASVVHAYDYRFCAFLIGSFFIFTCLEFTRYLYELTVPISHTIEIQATGLAVVAAAIVGIVALCLKVFQRVRIEYLYRISFATLIFSTLFFPLQMFQPTHLFLLLGYALSLVSYQCFNILNFATTIIVGKKRGCLVKTTGLAQGVWALSCILGNGLASGFAASNLEMGAQAVFMSSAAVITVLMVAFLFIFTERTQVFLMRTPITKTQGFTEDVCAMLSEKYGLSQRESEILVYLARGHNTNHIMEKLFISKSTVNTHRYHIYKKLGMTSQQELIDFVEKSKPDVPRVTR